MKAVFGVRRLVGIVVVLSASLGSRPCSAALRGQEFDDGGRGGLYEAIRQLRDNGADVGGRRRSESFRKLQNNGMGGGGGRGGKKKTPAPVPAPPPPTNPPTSDSPTSGPPTVPAGPAVTNDVRWYDHNNIEISSNDGGHIYKHGTKYYWVGNDLFQAENGNDIHMYSSLTLGSSDWHHEGMYKPTLQGLSNLLVHILHRLTCTSSLS